MPEQPKFFRIERKAVSRGKGHSASAKIAYICGKNVFCIYYGKLFNYARRQQVIAYSQQLLPAEAPKEFKDSDLMWAVAEMWDARKNSRICNELVLHLPPEFEMSENINILTQYLTDHFVNRGIGVEFAIHDKENGNNIHTHAILTSRILTPEGFGEKDRIWTKGYLISLRKSWADIQNKLFAEKGLDCRVSHLSYSKRGINKIPQKRLSKQEMKLLEQGIKTEKILDNEKIAALNMGNVQKKTPSKDRSYGQSRSRGR